MTISHIVTITYTTQSSTLQYSLDADPLVGFTYKNSTIHVGARAEVSLTKADTISALEVLTAWDRLLRLNFKTASFTMGMDEFEYVIRKTIPNPNNERIRGIFSSNGDELTDLLFRENLNRTDFQARSETTLSDAPEWTLWINFYQNIIDQLNQIS